jgi:hypothetical protein
MPVVLRSSRIREATLAGLFALTGLCSVCVGCNSTVHATAEPARTTVVDLTAAMRAPLASDSDGLGYLTSTMRPAELEGATNLFVTNKTAAPITITSHKVETAGPIDVVDVRLRDSPASGGEERERLMKDPPGTSLSVSTNPTVPPGAKRGLVVYSKLTGGSNGGPGGVIAVTLGYDSGGRHFETRYPINYVICPGPMDAACQKMQDKA